MDKTQKIDNLGRFDIGKMEMSSITGGTSTLTTEHYQWSGEWWQIGGWDAHGDAYPDDCCE